MGEVKVINKENKKYSAELKLISEFMGLKPLSPPYINSYMPTTVKRDDPFIAFVFSKMEDEDWYVSPRFKDRWTWLMYVVQKIESLENYGVTIYETECTISTLPDNHVKFNGKGKTKIEGTYNAILQFIKWWNKIK